MKKMESKKLIRIGMKITEAIIEILKEELGDEKKVKVRMRSKQKTVVKRNS
jgi:hypothetical protein